MSEASQSPNTPPRKDAGKIFLEELTGGGKRPPASGRRQISQALLIPLLAIVTGLLLGGIIIILTTEEVYTAGSIGGSLAAAGRVVGEAYSGLFAGAFGDPVRIVTALQGGQPTAIRRAFNPIFESLVAATPYAITGLPAIIHIPLALLAGALGGGLWGFIPGWLKAKTGGHEVINTIMMNYIAFRLSDWLLSGPMKRPDSFNPISPTIMDSAKLPRFFDNPIRFHLGFFIALLVAFLVYWFLFKTKWGFELRTVGSNPRAARYAGMTIVVSTVLAMALSGALAGLAGANEVLGLNYNLAMAFSSGYGFDSIALALLGKSHPVGVVLAALLFGTLRNGATRMQIASGVPIDIISILQAAIVAFIAAPAIIRTIYRLRQPAEAEEGIVTSGWGGN